MCLLLCNYSQDNAVIGLAEPLVSSNSSVCISFPVTLPHRNISVHLHLGKPFFSSFVFKTAKLSNLHVTTYGCVVEKQIMKLFCIRGSKHPGSTLPGLFFSSSLG